MRKIVSPAMYFLAAKWGKVKIRFLKPYIPSLPHNPHTEKSKKESKKKVSLEQ